MLILNKSILTRSTRNLKKVARAFSILPIGGVTLCTNDIFLLNQYLEIEDNSGKQIFGKIEELHENKIVISDFAQKSIYQLRGLLNEVQVHFKRSDASYQFQTDVLSIEYKKAKLVLRLPLPEEIVRNQQREYFRIQTRQKCVLKLKDDPTNENLMHTYDLSGGGISFMSKKEFEPGEYGGVLYLNSSIHGKSDLAFQCKLVHSEKQTNSNLFRSGFEFIGVTNLFRDKLIRFLMKEQLNQ